MKATNYIEKKLENYLKENIEKINYQYTESCIMYEEENYSLPKAQSLFKTSARKNNINNYINDELDKNNFQKTLFDLIDESGKKDSDIYNLAYIDRRLFSKIRSNENYHPSKNTVISLGLALNLDIENFEKLLNSASYSLPKNNYFDLIIRFCINEKIYNIIDVNNYLDKYNCATLT